jgi:hypothetical protein
MAYCRHLKPHQFLILLPYRQAVNIFFNKFSIIFIGCTPYTADPAVLFVTPGRKYCISYLTHRRSVPRCWILNARHFERIAVEESIRIARRESCFTLPNSNSKLPAVCCPVPPYRCGRHFGQGLQYGRTWPSFAGILEV